MPNSGPKVLIVDDEANIRQSLSGVLADENYQCTVVASGEACLEALAKESYEAIFLDIWLPGIDGLDTLARIQEWPTGARPAVIMISGHGNIETAVKATKLGAFDFVEKPLTIEKVSVVLKNAVGQRRMDMELRRLREDSVWPEIIGDSVAVKALKSTIGSHGCHQWASFDLWRERYWQRVGRARDSPFKLARQWPVCGSQLRGHSGGPDRE